MKSFTPFIIIILCVGVYFMYVRPWVAEINIQRAKKAEYVSVLQTAKELATKREAIEAEYNSITPEDLALFNKIVPDKFDPTTFANDIANIAARNRVTVKTLKADLPAATDKVEATAETQSKGYKTVVVTINASAKYEDFLAFLKEVESSLQLVDVVSLTMSSNNGGTQGPGKKIDTNPSYVVEVNTYSLQ